MSASPLRARLDRRVNYWAAATLQAAVWILLLGVAIPKTAPDIVFGIDWLTSLYPATQAILEGTSPYPTGLYPLPMFYALVPFAAMGERIGYFAVVVAALLGTALTVRVFSLEAPSENLVGVGVMAMFNAFTFGELWIGHIHVIELLGIVFGILALRKRSSALMGLAITLLAMLPPNTIPMAALLVLLAWKQGWRTNLIRAAAIPAGVFALSVILNGWWISEFVRTELQSPPPIDWVVSVWALGERMGAGVFPGLAAILLCMVWLRFTLSKPNGTEAYVAITLIATYALTPYVTEAREFGLIVVSLAFLSGWRRNTAYAAAVLLPFINFGLGEIVALPAQLLDYLLIWLMAALTYSEVRTGTRQPTREQPLVLPQP